MGTLREESALRIFINDVDHSHGQPLYHVILQLAWNEGLTGGTVMKAVAGFGGHKRLHEATMLDLAQNLPLVIEMIDETPKIEALIVKLEEIVPEGLCTVQAVRVMRFGKTAGIK